MTLVYSPTVTAQAINSAIKAAASSAGVNGGVIAWQKALNLIYSDFDSTLADAITADLKSGPSVMYTPPPSYSAGPLGIANVMLKTKAFANASGQLIDSTIKAQCSSMAGSAAAGAGAIAWTIVCKQIGQDLLMCLNTAIPPACWPACVAAYGACSAGLAATLGTMGVLGPQIDSAIKASAASAGCNGGQIAWTQALNIMMPYISTSINASLTPFQTAAIPL